jgi:hypothetical protein
MSRQYLGDRRVGRAAGGDAFIRQHQPMTQYLMGKVLDIGR